MGLIATLASVRSGVYEKTIAALDPEIQVYAKACPLFVPLVENGRFQPGDPVIEIVAREYLEEMRSTDMDTLILGCTHYPLLTDIIGRIMGPEVTLISAGEESAYELKRTLKAQELLADPSRSGDAAYYVSDRVEDFEKIAAWFLQEDLHHEANQIDIDRY